MGVPWYNEELLKKNKDANFGRDFQQCSISVMDTIADPYISFDQNGVCNYYYEYLNQIKNLETLKKSSAGNLQEVLAKIKGKRATGKYDCILGLSGGVDSSYLAYFAKSVGLNPLLVHFDYGWNSELAVGNIENIVAKLDLDLYTYVMDWNEFRDLQRSYFQSSVMDLDVPADHMIFGALYKVADELKIKFILSGKNVVTESVLPKSWNYEKFDLRNLKNIQKRHGSLPLKELPALGAWQYSVYTSLKNIQTIQLLDLVDYNKKNAKEILVQELGWRDYGGKHYESVFTRFYQGYILPYKFNIDKRKAHLSNLIFSGQLTKAGATSELGEEMYSPALMQQDKEFVAKKLGFSDSEFSAILDQQNVSHSAYGSDKGLREMISWAVDHFKPAFQVVKKIIHR